MHMQIYSFITYLAIDDSYVLPTESVYTLFRFKEKNCLKLKLSISSIDLYVFFVQRSVASYCKMER